MANTDGYYFTVATKRGDGPFEPTEGFNAVLWFSNFKAGGKNDNETPDLNAQMVVIYPMMKGAPVPNDPALLDDGRSSYKTISLGDGTKVSGSLKIDAETGAYAGGVVRIGSGNELTTYHVFKGDERVFYTDADGFKHQCMHYAPNPQHTGV